MAIANWFRTPGADYKHINVAVKNGVVRLTGTVSSGARAPRGSSAGTLDPGVRAVKDELRLETAKR